MNYYYTVDGTQVSGPHSLDEILASYREGSLPKTTQICEEGKQQWKSIETLANSLPEPQTQLAGPYGSATMQQNEVPIFRTTIHKAIYMRNMAFGCFPAVFFSGVLFPVVEDAPIAYSVIVLGILVVGLIIGIIAGKISRNNTELLITNRRVLVKVGLVSRRTEELFISQVESVAVSQGPFGRVWNYGTVAIRGTGGSCEPIRMIASPLEFRNRVQQMLSV